MIFSLEFFLAVVAVFIAGVLRGFSGFGAGMVLVPSLSLIYSPLVAVVTVVLLETIPAFQLLPSSLSKCHWNSVVPMSIVALFTVPLGGYLLVNTDANTMRTFISVLVIGCVLILATGWQYKNAHSLKASTVTGMASGLISGASGLGGLPVILYYLSNRHSASVVRASIVVFLVFTALVSLVTYIAHDIVTSELVLRTFWVAPVFIMAIWMGGHLFGKISELFFRRVTLTLLGSVGLVMLFS